MNEQKISECCEKNLPQKTPLSSVRWLISKFRFFPKMPDFFCYFEKSGENVVNGTRLLCQMIERENERPALLEQLKEYERVGDHITRDVINLLHQTFLTPFDRTDIHKLVVRMDDILDITYYVGNRMVRYNIKEMPEELGELARILCRSSEEVAKAVCLLRNMKNSNEILKHCMTIDHLETEADDKINIVIAKIFKEGNSPLNVIKIKELVECLERASDKCETVAHIIEGLILRNA